MSSAVIWQAFGVVAEWNKGGPYSVTYGDSRREYHTEEKAIRAAKRRVRDARAIARKYVAILGLGFHPDTRGSDYVERDGARVFSPADALTYFHDMQRLRTLCDAYAVSVDEWQKAGLLNPESAQ